MLWSAIASVSGDESVLQSTLLRSPALSSAQRLAVLRDFATVAAAYNEGIRKCQSAVAVFVHPDVYLPDNWQAAFERSLDHLQKHDPNWGVLGLYGVRHDGGRRGFLYSTGLGGFVGVPFDNPERVRTVDEFVFAIRPDSGLTCDVKLPSAQFQLGATDLCLQAERKGMNNYVLPCFTLHNSNGWSDLPIKFWRCYSYVRSKWRDSLPIELPYASITRFCAPMLKQSIRRILNAGRRSHRVITRVQDPDILFQRLRAGVTQSLG